MKKIVIGLHSLLVLFLLIVSWNIYSYADMVSNRFIKSGVQISLITSVGGKTLDEAYYKELGEIYSAYGSVTMIIGISISCLFIFLAVKQIISILEKWKSPTVATVTKVRKQKSNKSTLNELS